MKLKLLLMGVCLALLACQTPSEPSGSDIAFETIAQGSNSGHKEAAQYAITDQAEWETLWATVYTTQEPVPPVPDIHFEEQTVLAVFQGEHSTGGYAIRITNIKEGNGVLEVSVDEQSPGPGDIVTQAFTQPYHVVKVNSTLPVDWKNS